MKKALLASLIIFLLSVTVSATLYDFAKEQSSLSDNTLIVDESECSSFQYKLYVRFLRNFIVEVQTTNTDEHFYMILRENNCKWNVDILEEINERPDLLIMGKWNEENVYPYLDNLETKAKSFKGLIFGRIINDYL